MISDLIHGPLTDEKEKTKCPICSKTVENNLCIKQVPQKEVPADKLKEMKRFAPDMYDNLTWLHCENCNKYGIE